MTRSPRANKDVLGKSTAVAGVDPKKLGGAGVVPSFPPLFSGI